MNWLGLVGLVLVVLAALVVAVLAMRHRQQSASAVADRPRTVADLVRMREAAAAVPLRAPVREEAPVARPQPPAAPRPAPPPAPPAPPAAARSEAAPRRPATPAPAPVAAPVIRAAPPPEPGPPVAPAPPAAAPAVPAPRPPGPDIAGYDTPWHRAAVMAAGDGGTGTWEPPAPVTPAPVVAPPVVAPVPAPVSAVPVPLRLVPPVNDEVTEPDPEPDPQPDPAWTGWADWAEVDAEVNAEADARSPSSVSLPTHHPDSEAEHVALPLGRRTPAERAAEQAAADLALLRTFGHADPNTRPDNAPVVSMVRPDDENAGPEAKGADQPVRFRVVRRDGTAVAGAAAALLDNRGIEVAAATADADGRGEMLAPATGGFMLVCTAAGYQPGATAVTVADAPADTEVLLARSASVSGAVHGEDGPIAGARVTLMQDGEVIEAVSTDVDGHYRIIEIGSGEYGLAVAAPGWVPVAGHVDVPEEAGLQHDVTLAPASPTAATYDEAGHDGMMTWPR